MKPPACVAKVPFTTFWLVTTPPASAVMLALIVPALTATPALARLPLMIPVKFIEPALPMVTAPTVPEPVSWPPRTFREIVPLASNSRLPTPVLVRVEVPMMLPPPLLLNT